MLARNTVTSIVCALYLLFESGCGQPHAFPHTLQIDGGFSPESQALIVAAVDEWERATDGIVDLRPVVTDGMTAHVGVTSYSPEGRHAILKGDFMDDTSLGLAGIAAPFSCADNMWINSRAIRKKYQADFATDFKTIVMHELGHHLGLRHAVAGETGRSLMQPYHEDETPCIAPADLERFCELYDCEGHDVKTTCTVEQLDRSQHIARYEPMR